MVMRKGMSRKKEGQILAKQKFLEEVFDEQVGNFLEKGFPKVMNMTEDQFAEHLAPLKRKVKTMGASQGNHPFFIVPGEAVSLEEQMKSLHKMAYGHHDRFAEDCENLFGIKTPKKFYLVSDVSIGENLTGASCAECTAYFFRESRTGLTIYEGVALALHKPDWLGSFGIDLMGSKYLGEEVPYLFKSNYGAPDFHHALPHESDSSFRTPSCAKRIW